MKNHLNLPDNTHALLETLKTGAIPQIYDWDGFTELTGRTGFLPYIYANCVQSKNTTIPENALVCFRDTYELSLQKCLEQKAVLISMIKSLKEIGIDVIPLKGVVLSEFLYGKSALRPLSSDIDLLAKKEDAAVIHKIFTGLGYKQYFEVAWSAQYAKPGSCPIDVHWEYCAEQESPIRSENAWHNAVRTDLSGISVLTLSPADQFLYLAMVTNNDYCGCLRHFFDLHSLVRKFNDQIDWEYVKRIVKAQRLEGTLHIPIKTCRRLFNTAIPAHVLKTLDPGPARRKILDRLFRPERLFAATPPGKTLNPWIKGVLVCGGDLLRFPGWFWHTLTFEYKYYAHTKGKPLSEIGLLKYTTDLFLRKFR